MIDKSSSNLQKFFIESNSKFPNMASKESFYSEQSNQTSQNSRESQKQASSKTKYAQPKTIKTEVEHFFLKKKGDVEAYALNPQLGHIFHAKKRVIKVYKNGQIIQAIDIERNLKDEDEPKDSELFSEMVQEIMNLSIESFEEDESLLHFTHSRRNQHENSSFTVSRKLSQLGQSRPHQRQRLQNLNFNMLGQSGSKSILGGNSIRSADPEYDDSKSRSTSKNRKKGKKRGKKSRESSKKSNGEMSLDSQSKSKWRVSCIISVHQYLMVGFAKLDQVMVYKLGPNGKYEFSGKIDLKISKGFYKVIDMDYNPNSSYLCLVYSKFNLNNFTNENLQHGKSALIIEYGLINLTMLDAIKYSSKFTS